MPNPFLVSSTPSADSTSNSSSVIVQFRIDAIDGTDPASLDVRLDGKQAIEDGVFLAGYGGSVVQDGTALVVTISTHPTLTHTQCDCVIFVGDNAANTSWLSFAFLVVLGTVTNLKAKTWCDGKRIDLYFSVAAGVQRIKIRRSKYAYCVFPTDPGEDIYEGPPTNLDSSVISRFVDGVFSSPTYRTTNTALEEDAFYYYSIFVSYSSSAPYSWLVSSDCQVEGLSIKDYYSRYGDWVYKLLPKNYRDRDADPNRGINRYKLKDYCRVLQCGANLQRGWLEALLHLKDPDNMPAGRLGEAENQTGILAAQVWDLGVPAERAFDAGVLRRIVLGIVPIYKIKGTCPGLVDLTKMFAGWDARCDEQIEPQCGINRLFQTYDMTSEISYVTSTSEILASGYVEIPDAQILKPDGTQKTISLTSSGEPTVAFIIDALGTFVCVDSVAESMVYFAGGKKFVFTDSAAFLRKECFVDGTAGSGGSSQYTFNNSNVHPGSWPWQYPSPAAAPKFAKNAFKGLKLLDTTNTEFTIAGNEETDGSGDTLITVEEASEPATGYVSIAYAFSPAADFASRVPRWHGRLFTGEFSLTYDPTWDTRLLAEGAVGPWSLLTGLGSLNAIGFSATPADVVIWVDDVHEYLSDSTAVNGNVLTDDAAGWTAGQWVGYYVLPNWNQTKLYRVIDNTATELVVALDGGGSLATVSAAGFRYVILSPENALKYTQLVKLLPSFVPHESRGYIKFERVA